MNDKIPPEWNGHFIFHDENKKLEVMVPNDCEVLVSVGYQRVVIDKLFGPTAYAGLRIQADLKTCEWIIERQCMTSGEWKEWCRIPGQLDSDYE